MIMISTLLFMTNDKPFFLPKIKRFFKNVHFASTKCSFLWLQDRTRSPKHVLKRAKKAFLKPSWTIIFEPDAIKSGLGRI